VHSDSLECSGESLAGEPAVVVRSADPSDADAIARVHVDVWRSTYVGILPDDYLAGLSYSRRSRFWHSLLSDPNASGFVYVAEDAPDHIVGFVSRGPERTNDRLYKGELYAVYVLEQHQRKGIGRQLTCAAATELLRRGLSSMLVWVLAANPSREFYGALGGTVVRERVIEVGGVELAEIAYGWHSIQILASMHSRAQDGPAA